MISKRGSEIILPISYVDEKCRGEALGSAQGKTDLSGLTTNPDDPTPHTFHAVVPLPRHFVVVVTSL